MAECACHCQALSGPDGFAGLHLHLGHTQDGDSYVVARIGWPGNATQVLVAFAARQRLQRHAATDDTYDVGLIDAGKVHLGQAAVTSRNWIGRPKSSHHIARCKGLVPPTTVTKVCALAKTLPA